MVMGAEKGEINQKSKYIQTNIYTKQIHNKNLRYNGSRNYTEYLVNCCIPETQHCKLTIPKKWRRKWQPIPVFLPGELHGQGSLAGCRPWGLKELDTAELLALHSIPLYICTTYSLSLCLSVNIQVAAMFCLV